MACPTGSFALEAEFGGASTGGGSEFLGAGTGRGMFSGRGRRLLDGGWFGGSFRSGLRCCCCRRFGDGLGGRCRQRRFLVNGGPE